MTVFSLVTLTRCVNAISGQLAPKSGNLGESLESFDARYTEDLSRSVAEDSARLFTTLAEWSL